MNLAGKIVLVTGIMASGKSTVAQLLAESLDHSVHLRGDNFRKMIVNGRANMSTSPSEEAVQQLQLRYEIGISTALRYAKTGFAVIYQDVILGEYLRYFANELRPEDYIFVLCPDVNTIQQRETSRSKTGYNGFTPEQLDTGLRETTERLGYWLNNSVLTPQETVTEMLANIKEARLGAA